MHFFFENLAITNTQGLHASFMDIHRDTSFKSILEDGSISSSSRARIHFCSGKRARLWLVVKPFIGSFHIVYSTCTLALHFCLGLIQPSTFSLSTCECGHGLTLACI
jgi:hypothetical protein